MLEERVATAKAKGADARKAHMFVSPLLVRATAQDPAAPGWDVAVVVKALVRILESRSLGLLLPGFLPLIFPLSLRSFPHLVRQSTLSRRLELWPSL